MDELNGCIRIENRDKATHRGGLAVLANLENDVKWHNNLVETKNTSGGSLGVGATFLYAGELLGRRMETEYELTEYEPTRSAAWKNVSVPLPLKFWRTFECVDGGTRFTLRYGWDGEVRGFIKLAAPLITRYARRQHEGAMRKVKELMEARAL